MALGVLKFPVNKRQFFTVLGGPFRECPSNMKGVKMAKEIKAACAVDIPTVDYQTPDRLTMYRGMHKALDLMLAGEPLYVGCMGGMGRTGLFMACMAKAFGVKKPVEFVRANYYSHAVETEDQKLFVRRFTITPPMKRKINQLRFKLKWHFWTKAFWQTNLTREPGPVLVVLGSPEDRANKLASQRAEAALPTIEELTGSKR